MHVANDPHDPATGPFTDLLRLQAEFQTRMAEETLRYLRSVQATLAPTVPTTVLQAAADEALEVEGAPGDHVELSVELENVQQAYVSAAPALTPLSGREGTTWFPVTDPVSPTLVPPGETAELRIAFTLPDELPPGEYRGALLLQGFRQDALPVVVRVRDGAPETPRSGAGAKKTSAKKTSAKKTSAKKASAKKASAKKASAKKASAKKAAPRSQSAGDSSARS